MKNDAVIKVTYEQIDSDMTEGMPMELHIYTDFLRIVLEIINAIITYALPRNPEVFFCQNYCHGMSFSKEKHNNYIHSINCVVTGCICNNAPTGGLSTIQESSTI